MEYIGYIPRFSRQKKSMEMENNRIVVYEKAFHNRIVY